MIIYRFVGHYKNIFLHFNLKTMPTNLVYSLSLLLICVFLFGCSETSGNTDDSPGQPNEEDYGTDSYVENGEDSAPALPYDGVQMTKDLAELKVLVESLKSQLTQNQDNMTGIKNILN